MIFLSLWFDIICIICSQVFILIMKFLLEKKQRSCFFFIFILHCFCNPTPILLSFLPCNLIQNLFFHFWHDVFNPKIAIKLALKTLYFSLKSYFVIWHLFIKLINYWINYDLWMIHVDSLFYFNVKYQKNFRTVFKL